MFLKKLEMRPPMVLLRRMMAVLSGFFGRISPSAAARTRRSATAREVSGLFSGFGEHISEITYATAADTSKLLKIAGGTFSWDCHPVILKSGDKYVACSINTMPHGDQTITNNKYEGQFCLHMVGSITHGTETVNADHQAAIQTAYDWAH